MRVAKLIVGASLGVAIVACGEDPGSLRQGNTRGSGYSFDQGPGADGDEGASSGGASGGATSSSGSTSSGGASSSGASSSSTSSGGSSSSSTSSGSTTSSSGGGASTAAQICVDEINKYRATLGRPAPTRWDTAEPCSDGEAQSDSATGQAHGAFGRCQEMAQNECPGWPGPSNTMIPGCLKAMWGEGPGGGHYENMASTRYTKVACGFYVLPNGKVWSVQNFR